MKLHVVVSLLRYQYLVSEAKWFALQITYMHCVLSFIAMIEADIEIDLTAEGGDVGDEQRALTDRERGLRRHFGYKQALVQPSQILGTGSYGNVVKATLDDLPCAAKILHNTFFTSNDPHVQDFTRRFQLECRILRQLRHPCIVQFLGVLEDPRPLSNGRPILLMELMEESLTHFLESRQSTLPYHIQVNLTYEIALALDYLHANGILHRDLSSNNILLIGGARAKLTDFGMSKMVDINPRMTRNKQTMCPGTLAFMPPEALLSKPIYSDKIDVFSTGVLMVQIVTRRFPNPGDAHRLVRDPKYGARIQVPIPELERRNSDLLGVYLTHPLRPIALDCIKDDEGDRPTAASLCTLLAGLKTTPEYASSLSNYHQQVIALPPLKSAMDMRDTEIAVLDEQIQSLTLEKSRARGIFRKKDTSKLDADLADLQQRKGPLAAEREREQEEERRRVEYETENTQLKKRIEILENENDSAVTENMELKKYIARLEREKEEAISEQLELHQKIAELKQIIETYLLQENKQKGVGASKQASVIDTHLAPQLQVHLLCYDTNHFVSMKDLTQSCVIIFHIQRSVSLPSLKLADATGTCFINLSVCITIGLTFSIYRRI